jgi:hypothetical protein
MQMTHKAVIFQVDVVDFSFCSINAEGQNDDCG